MQEKEENSGNDARNAEILMAVLESGRHVELPATGYSMFPALRPGDRITVKPISDNIILQTGYVVVYRNNNQFIVHRIVKIIKDHEGISQIITRGDSRPVNDEPVAPDQILGVALTFRRKGKERQVRNYPVTHFRYVLNSVLLSWHFRMRQAYARLIEDRGRMRAFR